MKIDKKSLLLENERIYLRPLDIDDITSEYINGLNDPEVNRYLVNVRQVVQTNETVKKFIICNNENSGNIFFGIYIKHDKRPFVGTVRVSEIDLFHYCASIGICLFARRAWKKGYAASAINLVKGYLFNVIGLHYLEAGVYAENSDSIALFTKSGFLRSYQVTNKFRHNDNYKDVLFFSALNPNFKVMMLQQNSTGAE